MLLHWLIAGLIVGQFVLAKLAELAKESNQILDQLALLANHKSIGMTILSLAIVRLIIRIKIKPPSLPHSMARWQCFASHVSHVLLYGFLFALPVTGWLMSSAKAYSVSWFNLFAFPDLVSPSEALAENLHTAHHYLGEALFVIALIHILAALKHHFVDKDDVLKRMASIGGYWLFVVTGTIVILVFGRFFGTEENQAAQPQLTQTSSEFQASKLPLWKINYNDSFIKFSGDQAGAPFSGEWQRWHADIQFDATRLNETRFNVTIHPDSVFSNDQERDDHIRSTDFFDVARFTESVFQAQEFNVDGDGYITTGQLQMKGFTSEATLNFKVDEISGKYVLTGQATLDRLVWNIGSGDWKDTSWVGQDVQVEVRVVTN